MARKFILHFPHELHPDEVHARLSSVIEEQLSAAGDSETASYRRDGDGCAFTSHQGGFCIQGKIVISETEVTVTAEMPWIAGFFQGPVEEYITRQAAVLTGLPKTAPQDKNAS